MEKYKEGNKQSLEEQKNSFFCMLKVAIKNENKTLHRSKFHCILGVTSFYFQKGLKKLSITRRHCYNE